MHIKHPELVARYNSQPQPKCCYGTFFGRVFRMWLCKEEAVKPQFIKKKYKNPYDTSGRVCNQCMTYKLWSEYHRTRRTSTWYKTICKICTNINHKAYRIRTNYQMDRMYKVKTRKLNTWDILQFYDDIQEDILKYWAIQKWQVVDYKYMRGYKIRSLTTWYYDWLNTSNGPKSKKHKPFMKLDDLSSGS